MLPRGSEVCQIGQRHISQGIAPAFLAERGEAVKLALIFLQHAARQALTGLVPRENLYGLPNGN